MAGKGGGLAVEPVLEGTVALVTGASSGIGAATAAALAARGAGVALAARRRDRLEELAASINDRGGTALVLECDITDQQQAAHAVERTAAELGRLDTLINTPGSCCSARSSARHLTSGSRWSSSTCSACCIAPTRRCLIC